MTQVSQHRWSAQQVRLQFADYLPEPEVIHDTFGHVRGHASAIEDYPGVLYDGGCS